ncbi:hypothetical protein, partial [Escherichia coli]|uniref:hypothetical protein n=1 Tax=Escherichia coli TaxID=562 RepID=UPI002FE650C2
HRVLLPPSFKDLVDQRTRTNPPSGVFSFTGQETTLRKKDLKKIIFIFLKLLLPQFSHCSQTITVLRI